MDLEAGAIAQIALQLGMHTARFLSGSLHCPGVGAAVAFGLYGCICWSIPICCGQARSARVDLAGYHRQRWNAARCRHLWALFARLFRTICTGGERGGIELVVQRWRLCRAAAARPGSTPPLPAARRFSTRPCCCFLCSRPRTHHTLQPPARTQAGSGAQLARTFTHASHQGPVRCVDAAGPYVVSGGQDDQLHLYDIKVPSGWVAGRGRGGRSRVPCPAV